MKNPRNTQAWISELFGETTLNKDKSNDQILEVISRVMGHMNETSTLEYLHGVEIAGEETASGVRKLTLH